MKSLILPFLAVGLLSACSDRPEHEATETGRATVVESGVSFADPVPCTVPGMKNCTRTGDMIIGSQPSPEALEALAGQGVTTIVTTRGEGEIDWDERAAVEALGMRFVSIPMPSPVTTITDEQVAQIDAVLDSMAGPVLLHCGSGNRVSGLWAAWLAAEHDVPPEEALRLAALAGMGSVRPTVEQRLGVESTTP